MSVITQNNGTGEVVVGAGMFHELADPTHDHSDYPEGGPVAGFIASGQAIVDFGFASSGEGDLASTTVSAPWVTATSILVCTPLGTMTPDHDPDDLAAEGITAYVMNIVPGVGFDVSATAPNGTWGRYTINIRG